MAETNTSNQAASLADRHKQQELIESVNCLKVILPRMSSLGIPTTPENYTVWYRYSMGTILELNKAIDDLLNQKVKFTLAVNTQLYTDYILDRPALTRSNPAII